MFSSVRARHASPSSSEHSYITLSRVTLCHFQRPRKNNVSLLSPSYVRVFVRACTCAMGGGGYVHEREALLQHHLMAVTHCKIHCTHKQSRRKQHVYSMEITSTCLLHPSYLAEWEEEEWGEGEGSEQWMWKWQKDTGGQNVLRSGLSDLGRVRSQGLWPPRARCCQGNCTMILTLHFLNSPFTLPLSLYIYILVFFFISLFPLLKLKRSEDLLSALMMSAPKRRSLPAESQQLDF